MNPASDDRQLGEYRLTELIGENARARIWLAEQVSVGRRVLVDELRPECHSERDAFLADVRAKAAVEHPLIGSVYEAVSEPEHCFFAHELLPGTSLAQRSQAGAQLQPARLAHLLRRICEAEILHDTLGQATDPLGLENIHLDDHEVLRLDNLAISGSRPPEHSVRDIVRLGEVLPSLVADGQPGTSRMLTLLSWMRGEGVEAPLTWEQARGLCLQIEQQLSEPPHPATPTGFSAKLRKKPPIALVAVAGGIALAAILALALRMRPQAPVVAPRPALPGTVLIAAGKHPTPDGTEEELQAFRISACEVTIGQYAEFLEILDTLAKDKRDRIFDHDSQPQEKTSHLPDDWAALIAAAKAGGVWNGRALSLDHPVVGVDWWDASAYAEWKHARLATQEEWFAALRDHVPVPSTIQPAGWLAVTAETSDRTPRGLIGMAGSVCEWTRRPAANPANPLGERKWVIAGGSFLKPGSNALTREWTDDRALRRPDLGFRLVFDAD